MLDTEAALNVKNTDASGGKQDLLAGPQTFKELLKVRLSSQI